VEHVEVSRRRQLEYRALAAVAAAIGRAIEIAGRVGDQAGEGQCPVAAAGEAMEHGQVP
jgi:hypothetical protein